MKINRGQHRSIATRNVSFVPLPLPLPDYATQQTNKISNRPFHKRARAILPGRRLLWKANKFGPFKECDQSMMQIVILPSYIKNGVLPLWHGVSGFKRL
jgi:hypothetical protein